MDAGLREARQAIVNEVSARFANAKRARTVVQLLFVVGGTLLSTGAAFFSGDTLWPLTIMQLIGLLGIILVGLGSFFVHITSSSDDLLVKANEAIDSAEKFRTHAETVQDDLDYFREVSEGLRSLYIIYSTARGLLERAVTDRVTDEEKLIQELLSQTKTDLLLSLGFERNHTWTICVYRGLDRKSVV